MTNYYQNHRRYVKSIDSSQLNGDAVSYSSINGGDCKPVDSRDGQIIYPCGLIANSVFNGESLQLPLLSKSFKKLTPPLSNSDTFLQPVLLNPAGSTTSQTYNMTSRGIAWPGESRKYSPTKYTASEIVPPPNWVSRYPNGYVEGELPDLSTDEHFQVWMRTAGLPTFRKLYMRNDDEGMMPGSYQVDVYMSTFTLLLSYSTPLSHSNKSFLSTEQFLLITSPPISHPIKLTPPSPLPFPSRTDYPVAPFHGTKSLVFSTVSFIGGKNPFLGIAYIAVGGACILFGLVLTVRHLIRPRKLGDPQVNVHLSLVS